MDKPNTKQNENDNNNNNKSKRFASWDKYVYTISMFFNHMAYGISSNLFGPAMVDMKYIFDTSMDKISLFNTFNSTGYLLGSLCGFLYIFLNRQMTLILMIAVLGVGTTLIIYCPNVWILWLCSLISQMGGGAWDNANSIWLIEMWQQRSPAVLQFSQFMYGVGCILGPLLDEPYLTGELKSNNATNSSISTTISTITTTDINLTIDRRSKLELPFIIGGAIQSIIPVVFLIMLFLKKYKFQPPKDEPKSLDRSESSDIVSYSNEKFSSRTNIIESPTKNRNLMIGLTAICLASYTAIELIHFQFSSTYYQYIAEPVSAQKAARILSVMATSYTIGRFLSSIIAIKVIPEIMIIYHFCIIIVSMAVLYFGQNFEWVLWLGNAMIGVGFSAMWPAFFAFAEKYIKMTNNVSTIFSFSSGLIPLTSPFIIGPYIENYPLIFTEVQSAYLITSIALFCFILYTARRSTRSFNLIIINN